MKWESAASWAAHSRPIPAVAPVMRDERADRLARFARASIDGALLAERVDRVPLAQTLRPLPLALLAVHRGEP
ncbi:hypothetical protein AB0H71_18835 [Nocardia sp. NPDC050697]|uniref:hypothetical protein n=1 Tax=Nocardia sp. NPDC050697 TaxID=3155158 RepID=UPI003402C400